MSRRDLWVRNSNKYLWCQLCSGDVSIQQDWCLTPLWKRRLAVSAEWCGKGLQPVGNPYKSLSFPLTFDTLVKPQHCARKALSATPGLAPGGLGSSQISKIGCLLLGAFLENEKSGVDKMTRSSLKSLQGVLKQGPFDCKNGRFASSFSPLKHMTFER